MSLEQYYLIAQIVASFAVVGSLLFLGFEVRRNAKQTRLANWESSIDRFNTLWARTNDLALADIVVRGRKGLSNLTETERLAFGHYHEEMVISYESMTVRGDHPLVESKQLIALGLKHLRFHFGFPGAREWWEEWKRVAGPPPAMVALVNEAIRLGPPD